MRFLFLRKRSRGYLQHRTYHLRFLGSLDPLAWWYRRSSLSWGILLLMSALSLQSSKPRTRARALSSLAHGLFQSLWSQELGISSSKAGLSTDPNSVSSSYTPALKLDIITTDEIQRSLRSKNAMSCSKDFNIIKYIPRENQLVIFLGHGVRSTTVIVHGQTASVS